MSSKYLVIILATKNRLVSRCWRTLRGEGRSAAGWSIGGSVIAATAGPKAVRSVNGLPLIAPRRLLLLPLRIVNRCCSGIPVSGGGCLWMSAPLTL